MKTTITAYRAAVCLALAAGFILTWGNLALGVIGSEDERANMMYIGVLVVGIIGAIIARFQPDGMARALVAMALAQAVAGAIALIAGMHEYPGSSAFEILGLTGFFVGLFLGSAWLFLYAAREQRPTGAALER